MNSLYNSRNFYEIFRKFLKISENFWKFQKICEDFDFNLKNLSFIQKIQNAIAKQNSGISIIFDKTAVQKEIWLYLLSFSFAKYLFCSDISFM